MKTVLPEPLAIDAGAIKKAASVFRAIHHSLRLQIIEIVHKAGRINVSPITEKLGLEQPIVSGHLKILREARFLKAERDGKSILYSIDYEHLRCISDLSGRLVPYSINSVDYKPAPSLASTDAVTFTPIEITIIRLICEEKTEEEIARKLGLSRAIIEAQTNHIIKKMKVRNSVGILFFAIRVGLFSI